eukprot:1181647-Prorocentrum_minimum.AAC.8
MYLTDSRLLGFVATRWTTRCGATGSDTRTMAGGSAGESRARGGWEATEDKPGRRILRLGAATGCVAAVTNKQCCRAGRASLGRSQRLSHLCLSSCYGRWNTKHGLCYQSLSNSSEERVRVT